MKSALRKPLIVIACLGATALGVYLMVPPPSGFEPGVEHRRPHVCEACGCRFMELPAEGALACPRCGGEAVAAKVLVCGQCGAELDAYRYKVHYVPVAPKEGGEPLVGPYYKRPGGPWVRSLVALGPIVCPECGNADPAQMREKTYAAGPG